MGWFMKKVIKVLLSGILILATFGVGCLSGATYEPQVLSKDAYRAIVG